MFHLKQQQLIEMIRETKIEEALNFARDELMTSTEGQVNLSSPTPFFFLSIDCF